MSNPRPLGRFLPGLLLGFLGGAVAMIALPITAQSPPEAPQAPAPPKKEALAHRGLDASLWMQTAAEYRACCLQAYNLATLRLQKLSEEKPVRPRAVIMDLDETVLDNAGFQAMILRSGLAFSDDLWDAWEFKYPELVGLIPGAREFIGTARELGFTVVYISNRSENYRASTVKALKCLKIEPTKDEHLLLNKGNNDKTERRDQVRKDFEVVMLVGDNLRDFDEDFAFSKLDKKFGPDELIRARKAKVDAARDKWGREFIILPNSAYGEWQKPLNKAAQDYDRLVPTFDPKKK
jgi:acid phosphatase